MRGESMKDKSKKSTYSTTFGVDPCFAVFLRYAVEAIAINLHAYRNATALCIYAYGRIVAIYSRLNTKKRTALFNAVRLFVKWWAM